MLAADKMEKAFNERLDEMQKTVFTLLECKPLQMGSADFKPDLPDEVVCSSVVCEL